MIKNRISYYRNHLAIPLAGFIALLSIFVLFSYGDAQSQKPAPIGDEKISIFLPVVADNGNASSSGRDGLSISPTLDCASSSPITVSVPEDNSSSNWLPLTDDPEVVAVQVSVISGGAGNIFHLVEDWGAVVASAEVETGTVLIDVPASVDVSEGIQFYVEHVAGSNPYQAVVRACTESAEPPTPTNTPTHTPTNTPIVVPPTKTPTPTSTSTPTNTPVSNPPTSTPTHTSTPSQPGTTGCTTVPNTPKITLAANEWATNWKSLLEDGSMRDQITGVQLTINSANGAGNRAMIFEDWSPPVIAEVTLSNGPDVVVIPLPANDNARLEIQIENSAQVAVDIDIMLCTGVPPTVTPEPNGMPKIDSNSNPVTGQASGLPLSQGFGEWADHPGVAGTLSQTCEDLHDSYWVEGADGKVYHTWHPSASLHPTTQEGCVWGHEHGMNPFDSALFDYSGGWPAFGFALEQFNSTLPAGTGPRFEDHVGHKITVARYRAAIGNPPNTNEAIYDAGFYCDFMSKIHQGSHSNDAYVNHLHEYYLNVACDDTPGNPGVGITRTKFSLKMVLPFGEPNQFTNMCFSNNIVQAANNVTGLSGQLLPIAQVLSPTPASGSNPREFTCMNPDQRRFKYGTADFFNQFDLWTQLNEASGPDNLKVNFQSYYVIKDSARGYDNTPFNGGSPSNNESLRYTVDLCEKYQGENPKFCEELFTNNNGVAPDPYSTKSTFKGALRAVNFKVFPIYNNSTARSGDDFCSDPNGNYVSEAANGSCPSGQILQKIANTFDGHNDWWTWTNPATGNTGAVSGSLYVEDQAVVYPKFDSATNSYSFINGLQQPDAAGNGCPYGPVNLSLGTNDPYCPVGIGFEKIVDMRNSVPQAIKNAVGINSSGQQYNTDLHAPN